jgi:hypothetical protein
LVTQVVVGDVIEEEPDRMDDELRSALPMSFGEQVARGCCMEAWEGAARAAGPALEIVHQPWQLPA